MAFSEFQHRRYEEFIAWSNRQRAIGRKPDKQKCPDCGVFFVVEKLDGPRSCKKCEESNS